jgi:thiol-disulfide isomerase/thioredoxin
MKKVIASLIAFGLMVSISGCASDPLADPFRSGSNKNYISGDGSVTEFKGKLPVGKKWHAYTMDSQEIYSDALLGHVTVLNFWYAGCAPCRAETPDLAKLATQYADKGVQMLGVNVRDSEATAMAFARTHKLNYPSVMDIYEGAVVKSYTGVVSPSAVPTTLVINAKGEITSRVLGRFEPGTLKSLIDTALKG